jgi:hypothetical protein
MMTGGPVMSLTQSSSVSLLLQALPKTAVPLHS